MHLPQFRALLGSLALTTLASLAGACAEPCKDDGLGQKYCPADEGADGATSADEAEGTAEESAESTADTTAESGESVGETTADTDADMDADATADTTADATDETDTAVGPCENGIQDGDETDIDCGGSCELKCQDGDACFVDPDCESNLCNEGFCTDPVCNPDENNSCQGCLQQNCCDTMIACFDDPACTCWFECISHNNDFEPCKTSCNVGNIGTITSCANSECNYIGACGT